MNAFALFCLMLVSQSAMHGSISLLVEVENVDLRGGMTRGMLGLPAEPYVFSNDLGAAFGPPSWERAKFHLGAAEQRVSVRLRGSR